jgi:hypothetical protein
MTYRELLNQLQVMTEEQLNCDVCIWDSYDNDEFHQEGVEVVFATPSCQVLDTGHPIIRF